MKIHERIAAVVLSAAILTGLSAPMPFMDGVLTVQASAATTVKAPTASLKAGTYVTSSSKKVKLTCGTKGAEIWYCTSGNNYKKYTKAITISKNTTLKFYAKKNGVKSKIVTVKYKLSPEIKFSVNEGRYYSEQTVKLSSKLKNVTFYYTLDGTKPIKSSAKYNASTGIKITKDSTLRVMAVKKNWTNSYANAEYKITSGSSILDDYTQKYFYQSLTQDKKELYTCLYNSFVNYESHIELPKDYLVDDFDYVFNLLTLENPQLFYLSTAYAYYYYPSGVQYYITAIDPKYYWSGDEAAKMRKTMDNAATKILKSVPDGSDTFTTILTYHDTLVNDITYTLDDLAKRYCAYGAFADGEAVCGGYSQAFSYLCQMSGLQCVNITGYTDSESEYPDHEWNRVMLEGEWYNMDVTWDDPDYGSAISHEYFCATDDFFNTTHLAVEWFPYGSFDEADCTDMNYFVNMDIKFYTDPDEAYEALLKECLKNYQKGITVTGIYCSSYVKTVIDERLVANFDIDIRHYGYTNVPTYWSWVYRNDYLSFKVE